MYNKYYIDNDQKYGLLDLAPNYSSLITWSIPRINLTYKEFNFPGGESHIVLDYSKFSERHSSRSIWINHRVFNGNDIIRLYLTIDALRREGVTDIHLVLPYVPYARQDRVMTSGEPFSMGVFAEMINNLCLTSITIFDPHSDVASALLKNCVIINNHEFIRNVITGVRENGDDMRALYLIVPDAGANKKMKDLASFLTSKQYNIKIIYCDKTRDIKTGKISGFTVYTDALDSTIPCIIVDDICDGGGTFIGLGSILKQKGAKDLYLAVSHGIFSNGMQKLNKMFKQIYTTDSFINRDKATDQLIIHNVGDLI